MKGYFLSLFVSSVVILIVQVLAESQTETKKYVQLISGFVTVLILFNPLLSLINELAMNFSFEIPDLPQSSIESENHYLLDNAESLLSKKIRIMIEEEYEITVKSVEVFLKYDDKQNIFCIQEIQVELEDDRLIDEITSYLKKEFSCDITVLGGD